MKKSTIILIFLSSLFFVSTLVLIYLNYLQHPPKTLTSSVEPTIVSSPTPFNNSTTNWISYTDKMYAFSLSYPSDWSLVENSISDTVSSVTADKVAHQIEIKYKNQTMLLINPELPLGYGSPFTKSTVKIGSKNVDVYTSSSSLVKHYRNFNLSNFPNFSIDTYDQNPEIDQILSTLNFSNTTASGFGTVTGNLCYPSEAIPPGNIIAKNISTNEIFIQKYPGTTVDHSGKFSFQLQPGTYHFKFELNNGFSGYYDKCAKTMESSDCDLDQDHYHFDVIVNPNQKTSGISICDFYYSQEQQKILYSTF